MGFTEQTGFPVQLLVIENMGLESSLCTEFSRSSELIGE